jgi:hypothetical protein
MRLFMGLALILSVQASVLAAVPPKLAVLGGEKAGWDDLLVARLSKAKTVSIVERQRLGAVFDERAIQGLLENRADRGRIASIAGADLLVLLAGNENGLRLVVCDSHLGVTLEDLSVPAKDKTRENVVAALADRTLRIVRQFEGGVKHVVAVPDFVSRDLTFDYSFLQFDYAEVLRAAYRQTPGLAIVAVEEARSIAAERDLVGIEPKDRLVPVFVEGEYRTERGPKDASTSVQITLRARGAAKNLWERKLEAVPLDQAGGQLLAAFTKDLAGLTQTGGPAIDTDGQYRLLTQRAEEFSSLGEFRRSAALREAALLLKPDADEQRIRLVREYTRRNDRPIEYGDWPKGARQDENDPFWMALVVQVVSDWKRSLQHCEYLIRNGRLCREEATDLAYNALHSITGACVNFSSTTGMRTVYSTPLVECEAIKKDFLRHAFVRIALLDPAAKTGRVGLTGALDVYNFIFTSALMRCDGKFYDGDDLDLIADLLLTRLPESMWPSHKLNFFLLDVGEEMGREGKTDHYRFTDKQYQAFLDQLVASDRPLVRVYGRYGKFCYRRYNKREKSPELLQEAQAIVAEAQRAGFDLRQYEYYMNQLRVEVERLSRDLASKTPTGASVASKTPSIAASRSKSRVILDPVELTLASRGQNNKKATQELRWRGVSGWGGIQGYRPLGDGLDAFWAGGAVLFMRQPGKLVEVLANEQLSVDDVIDDGRYVWIAASHDWGLSIFDRSGKELLRITKEHGLPPCDGSGMVVYPLATGRVLAAGSFGNEHRAWIAMVEFDGSKGKVEVVHEGTKVWDPKDRNKSTNTDPTMTFVPEAMVEHTIPGPNPRRIIFILGRNNPLLLDPETRKVWVYPVTNGYRQNFPRSGPQGDAYLSIDGILWIANTDRDFRSYSFDEETGRLQVVRDKPNAQSGGMRDGSLARDGDWLYYAGSQSWRRLNLVTRDEELLDDDPRALPKYGSGNAWRLANSSHYGLVAFRRDTLYRVQIGEGNTTKP